MLDDRGLELRGWFHRFVRGEQLWNEAESSLPFVRVIARQAGVDSDTACLAFLAHDLGKAFWPNWLFERRLDRTEWVLLQSHVNDGVMALERLPGLTSYHAMIQGVGTHHERWDGTGYPRGLYGPAIPHLGLVLSVADALSAMLRDRPWAAALPMGEALTAIEKGAGTQFHPDAGRWVEPLRLAASPAR